MLRGPPAFVAAVFAEASLLASPHPEIGASPRRAGHGPGKDGRWYERNSTTSERTAAEPRTGRCSIIGSPFRKVFPSDNLPAKIRPARRPPERDGFLPVNYRPWDTFLWDNPIMGGLFMGPAIF